MCRNWKTLSLLALMALAATAAQAVKVDVCHFPPGNIDNWHTISVSENALNAHFNHGDLEGSCYENCETICDDGDACTQDVEPDAAVCICKAEPTPVNCDDGNPCTADSCSSEVGACVYDTTILDGTACDDGDPDTSGDVCTDGVCAGTGAFSCEGQINGTLCDDGDPTTVNSTCQSNVCVDSGLCVHGVPFYLTPEFYICDCHPDWTGGNYCELPTGAGTE